MGKDRRLYYIYKQSDEDSNAKHLNHFNNQVIIVEFVGENLVVDVVLVEHEKTTSSWETLPKQMMSLP